MQKTYLRQGLFKFFCKIYWITDGPVFNSQIATCAISLGLLTKHIWQCGMPFKHRSKSQQWTGPKTKASAFLPRFHHIRCSSSSLRCGDGGLQSALPQSLTSPPPFRLPSPKKVALQTAFSPSFLGMCVKHTGRTYNRKYIYVLGIIHSGDFSL